MTHIGDAQIETLYPAVVECFAIILIGYIAGRLNLISSREAKGLNTFVSHFSLPSLIFMSLVTIKFHTVNWMFLLSIFASKTFIFIFVGIITAIVSTSNRFSKAALFSIFCTQSNDFALGYPVVEALYKTFHPEYANYLYLVAPVSLVILNPIGFVMLEIEKRTRSQDHSMGHMVWKVCRGIILNPVVLMTICGVIGNFIFEQQVPLVLEGILKVLGSAFSATALFCLGLKMVGRIGTLQRRDLMVSSILIGLKILVLPLITRETVILLKAGSSSNETADLSAYGFLYGTFPPAPGIFVFAQQYNVESDMIATGLIGCTFLSAPLIFVSAKMISMHFNSNSDYLPEFQSIFFNVGLITFFACVWSLIFFFMRRKWKLMPHWFTFCLLISQTFICISAILWNIIDHNVKWQQDLQMILFTSSVYSSRIWTALLALGIFLLRWRSLCFVLRYKLLFIGIAWGLPISLSLTLWFFSTWTPLSIDKIDPNFIYGHAQVLASTFVLLLSLLVTLFCLIVYQKLDHSPSEYQSLLNHCPEEPQQNTYDALSHSTTNPGAYSEQFSHCNGQECHVKKDKSSSCCLQDMEDLIEFDQSEHPNIEKNLVQNSTNMMCDITFPCTVQTRQRCVSLLRNYKESTDGIDDDEGTYDHQYIRHHVLLFLLCFSMFVGLSLCVWQMMLDNISGIYVELEFLDGILNIGQGFLIFAIFALDVQLVATCKKWWRKLTHQRDDNIPSGIDHFENNVEENRSTHVGN